MMSMKIKLENKLDESIMSEISGGAGATITIDKSQSADETVNYPAARTTCPICGKPASMDFRILLHGDGMGHYAQVCTDPLCGYKWTYGTGKISVE